MRRARLAEADPVDAGTTHFTGAVRRHDLIEVDDPASSILLVRFEPDARTHWHRHPNGQYLYGVDGEGRVQSRGGEVTAILPGDVIYAEPGEEHWHGASHDEAFSQLAISHGVTEWAGAVESDS